MVSTRSASRATSVDVLPATPPTPTPLSKTKASSKAAAASSAPISWSYTPPALILLWLAISLPLVTWDTGYVLGRPYTMEGGHLHWPLWVPYKLYGEVDHVYGWKAWNGNNGFTGAQSAMNVVETVLYGVFLWIYATKGQASGEGAIKTLTGRPAAEALLVGFSAALMTLSKTVLYWLQEYYSGFDGIGHNDLLSLIFLWIIPNGAWLVLPTYMIYVMGGEIIDGLTLAGGAAKPKSS